MAALARHDKTTHGFLGEAAHGAQAAYLQLMLTHVRPPRWSKRLWWSAGLVGQTATVNRGNMLSDLAAAASLAASPAVCLSTAPAAPPRHHAPQTVPNRPCCDGGGVVGTRL